MRVSPLIPCAAAALLALASGACGKDAPGDPALAKKTPTLPARETIDPAVEAKVREKFLEARDEPLAVGVMAPPVEGVSTGKPALLLFYRGHW